MLLFCCQLIFIDLTICIVCLVFYFNYPSPTEIYTDLHTLSLHDALPIYSSLLRFVHSSTAREVSSGPLSETIVAGRPRRAISASSSRTTRAPPIEVSTVRTSASRVKSSTTASTRNRRPQEIGRAPCRERVCQYVEKSVVAVSLQKK